MTPIKIRFRWLLIPLLTVATFSTTPIYAQTYKIGNSNTNSLNLLGTSTLHNWEMIAHTLSGTGGFIFGAGGDLQSLSSLVVSIPVRNLKSEHSGLDDNAYDALKADKYSSIVYKLTSASITTDAKSYVIKAVGTLTIAGATRPISMDVHAVVNNDNTITVIGSETLKMSDYKIDPPSFMLGTMSAGDKVTINFHLLFTK